MISRDYLAIETNTNTNNSRRAQEPVVKSSSDGMGLGLNFVVILTLGCGATVCSVTEKRPHIVFILADDLGFGDVGWNNKLMADVTKRMARIAARGVTLSQYYVQQVCTPSRSALLTGMYPYHIGRQKGALKPRQPTGLTLNRTLLSDRLQTLGYRTHVVGKWHLGFCNLKYTPTHRGFNTFRGFYTGAEHYYDHTRAAGSSSYYDFRINNTVDTKARGHYSTDLITNESLKILKMHSHNNISDPLFLYVPYQATHAPLEAPESEFKEIKRKVNAPRDVYRAMLARLDKGVRLIVQRLKSLGMWDRSLLVFSTDNGGSVSRAGSNHPLRGTKGTLFEGGTHGVGFVAGGFLGGGNKGAIHNGLFHITDWYPTLLAAANDTALDDDLDGVSQWDMLKNLSHSNRTEIVYNLKILPVSGAIRVGDYKLMFARKFNKDGWYNIDKQGVPVFQHNNRTVKMHRAFGVAKSKIISSEVRQNVIRGMKLSYNKGLLLRSGGMVTLKNQKSAELFGITSKDEDDDEGNEEELDRKMLVNIRREQKESSDLNEYQLMFIRRWPNLKKHLFKITDDPEERNDLQEELPDVMEEMRLKVLELYGSFVERDYPDMSYKSDPARWGGNWSPGWC